MMDRFEGLPPYPNGWYQVAYSDEIAPGQVEALHYFGKDFVVFRSENGTLSVLDAHCSHMGAHLGHGGRVCGQTIECPFHAWKFDTEGKCVEIPYAQKIPSKSPMRSWAVTEINSAIYVWFHNQGEAPQWELEAIAQFDDVENWEYFERRRWQIKSRNQEMAENSVDKAHFKYVHHTQNVPPLSGGPDAEKPHILRLFGENEMTSKRGNVDGTLTITEWGFGLSTTKFTGFVETLLLSGVTPIDEENVDVRFTFLLKKAPDKDITEGVGKMFVAEVCSQLEEDIPIWENKIFLKNPVLCDGDGPIGMLRKWGRQFYT
jgi:3-ketosteroid 9alpha-monooxygenase subunit A